MDTKVERIKRDIEEIGKNNATPGQGLTRFSFTQEDKGAREYIKNQMKEAGLEVYEDPAGTVVGRLEGKLKDAPVVMLGSHFDSVKNGGNFDGPAGVVMALEIARVFHEKGLKPKCPIEFIAMIEEEGGRFGGGLFGSRAMVGDISREQLDSYKDKEGISIAQAMRDFGFDPEKIEGAKKNPEDVKAFFELHIEQGPILENKKIDLGIVEYIVGIKQVQITIKGRADHAGNTPMDMRKNALDGAKGVLYHISDYAIQAGKGTVATIGTLDILPGAANIVPQEVKFTIDIRSKDEVSIDEVVDKVINTLNKDTQSLGLTYEIIHQLNVKPTKLPQGIIDIFKKEGEKLGFSTEIMVSGAGHDAMVMANITDIGLIFVPSKKGRSHCPEEWTDYEDLQKGIELIYEAIKKTAEVK